MRAFKWPTIFSGLVASLSRHAPMIQCTIPNAEVEKWPVLIGRSGRQDTAGILMNHIRWTQLLTVTGRLTLLDSRPGAHLGGIHAEISDQVRVLQREARAFDLPSLGATFLLPESQIGIRQSGGRASGTSETMARLSLAYA
jgi:hypothetical protein